MSKKVLLIEDERDLVDLYTEVLVEVGFTVVTALDGETGTEKIKNEDWDLLLLDVMLPDKDGMAMLEEIHNTSVLKKGPVIVLTNLNREDLVEKSVQFGASGYLVKSEVSLDDIVAEVKKHLG